MNDEVKPKAPRKAKAQPAPAEQQAPTPVAKKRPERGAGQDTWKDVNAKLQTMGEKECADLLKLELKAKNKRPNFCLRIQSRFNKLRGERERRELIEKLKG